MLTLISHKLCDVSDDDEGVVGFIQLVVPREQSPELLDIAEVKPPLLVPMDCSPFFWRTGSVRMNFDVSAVQCKNFNSFSVNDLCLKFPRLFGKTVDEVEDSDVNPVSESPINGRPIVKIFVRILWAVLAMDIRFWQCGTRLAKR